MWRVITALTAILWLSACSDSSTPAGNFQLAVNNFDLHRSLFEAVAQDGALKAEARQLREGERLWYTNDLLEVSIVGDSSLADVVEAIDIYAVSISNQSNIYFIKLYTEHADLLPLLSGTAYFEFAWDEHGPIEGELDPSCNAALLDVQNTAIGDCYRGGGWFVRINAT